MDIQKLDLKKLKLAYTVISGVLVLGAIILGLGAMIYHLAYLKYVALCFIIAASLVIFVGSMIFIRLARTKRQLEFD